MAKQKAKTVDMSVTQEDLDKIVLPEEEAKTKKSAPKKKAEVAKAEAPDEKTRLKELKDAEKAEKKAKKLEKEAKLEEIQEKIEVKAKEGKKSKSLRSKRYQSARAKIDRTKTYPLAKASELILETSYSSFAGTIVADLIVRDDKTSATLSFPHSTGKSVRVAIADDNVLAQIEAGQIDFDILLAEPKLMPKIAKYARVLGPKGLMPNPKNNTVTDDPQKRKKELEGGKITVKTEKKAPLMHVVVGKTDLKPKEVVDNTETLIKSVGPKKILKLVLSATMSPGIKVDLTPYQTA
jgi:large subunit ribosomal protein L1